MKNRTTVGAGVIIALLPLLAFSAWAQASEGGEKPTSFDSEATRAAIPKPLTLSWCLERAREANPTLQRVAAQASAARHRIVPAGSLEDPRLAYEASNIPTGDLDFHSTPLSGHQFRLRQKLPVPGLLSRREEAARRAAQASALLVEDQGFLTDSAVEVAWAELGFAQQALDITSRNIGLLRQLSETAESRYRVGSGLQQDVLRAQVELTALLRERLRRVEAIERAESRLVELLDLPATTRLSRTSELRMTTEEPLLRPLLGALEERSTRLRAAGRSVEAARARVRAVELEGLPDVDLGIGYRVRSNVTGDRVDGDDFLSAGVVLRIPVNRSKWRARVAEQKALLRRAEADYRATRAALASQTRRAHAELIRAASEEALLVTGLVPQAQQSLESSRSGYKVGRIGFLSLLDSQVRLLGAELRLARTRADKRLAFAALESAAGEKLR
ncbi:MAG: TolC family protein [bacterium]|nr:TolC family protein [bacterium]